MNYKQLLDSNGAIHLHNVVPIEFCQFFTHALLRCADLSEKHEDPQVPNAKAVLSHELLCETLQERLWTLMESIVGEELLPTYSYARLYSNGDDLEKHKDREACEISASIQLGRSHHYAWPIYMGGNRYDMAEGDAIIYKGCDIEHWRNVCDGPEGYYSGQLFIHFVKKNGANSSQFGDPIIRDKFSYFKNRTIVMEQK
jgi:hypothetical protein